MRFFSIKNIIVLWGIIIPLNVAAQNASILFSSGQDLYDQAKYEQAAHHFSESGLLYLQQKDSINWVRSRYRYGDALIHAGKIQKGLNALLSIDEHKSQKTPINLKALIKNYIGLAYRKLEQYDNSKAYYRDAIELADMTDDSVLIGRLNNNISYPYLYSGDYERAFSYQKKAKEIYESAGEYYRLSFVLNGMFATLRELGLHVQANRYLRQSTALREAIGNPDLLDIAYHNMAVSFKDLGKADSAIIFYRKSLELARELGNPFDITQTLNDIGALYERSGDYEKALAYYNEALETNYKTERPVSIANNLKRLADVAIQNNDLVNAESFYEEALSWMEKVNAPQELAGLYLNIAELKLEQGNFAEAKQYVADAQKISHKNFSTQQYHAHRVLGKIYKTEGKWQESLAEYSKAYDLYTSQTATVKITLVANLARIYHKLGSDSAFIYAKEAFTLIDSSRTNVAGVAFRSGFFRKHAGFYNEVASWYITQEKNPEKAFELIEAAKARVLMDELAEAQEKVYETLDEATLIKKQQKTKQIDRLYHQLAEAETEKEKSIIRKELKDMEFEYQSFLNEIQAGTPELKNFEYPKPISYRQVQDMIDGKTAILEYAFAGNSLVRILITEDDINGVVIDSIGSEGAKNNLTDQIKEFRNRITKKSEVNEIKALGLALHNQILPDLQNSAISNLLFITDGPLTFLPFEALSYKGRYLIESFNIKYLPSVSIYTFIHEPEEATSYDLLAVAGSGFEEADTYSGAVRSQSAFASLPSTLLEVDSIAVNFPDAKILKNEDVSEATLKSFNLGDFRFLHFATHAFVNETTPSQSGLLLSNKAEDESLFGEDGFLNSREISGLKLNADLVTLSACNTGMGKIITGEGLLGLQRSFISAGASSVIVSLWSIFDRSTSEFMSVFYKKMLLHEEKDYGLWSQTLDWFGMYEVPMFSYKSKALRDTKLTMINHPYYNHPVYWAPFILIGK